MQTPKESLPCKVNVREIGLWIPLSSGHRLAARLWLPTDADIAPVPALLEFLPYRKRDLTRMRDEPIHHFFAEHGYASIRVDMRGSGDSFGVMRDEYEIQELDDAVEVIAWLAAQAWCNGNVGMFGVSWGGFNALQVAARRPNALKAIITSCSTDDRYSDDMHYMGGCLLVDNLDWGTLFLSLLPMPGDPDVMGPDWRANWIERLQAITPPTEIWMLHQARDEYWKHGSICEDFGAIQCPVMAVSGWFDGYSNAVPRLLTHLRVPRLGIIGPHAHQFGFEDRPPGPAYGFLQEALRWWGHWLKAEDTGVMHEPMLRAFMFEDMRPAAAAANCPGKWIAESQWPPAANRTRVFFLNVDGLGATSVPGPTLKHSSLQTVGLMSGKWCPYGTGGGGAECPGDQQIDDALSMSFDSDRLTERLEILGAAVLSLELSVDRPVAAVAVRLCDVHEDGTSTRVTYGVLNLAHRSGSEQPVPVKPGERYKVRLQLNDAAYAFLPGHRIRVAISTSYWPIIWPSPEQVTLSIYPGDSSLEIPVRDLADAQASRAHPMPPPKSAPKPATEMLEPAPKVCERNWDVLTGYSVLVSERGSGMYRYVDNGVETGRNTYERMRIHPADPLSASAEFRVHARTGHSGWRVDVSAVSTLTADRSHFNLTSQLTVQENGTDVFVREWNRQIARGDL